MDMSGVDEATARGIAGIEAGDALIALPMSMRPAVEIVQACLSQLRYIVPGMGKPVMLGFDFPALDIAAKWLGHAIDRAVLSDIKALEHEARRILNGSPS